MGFVENLIFFLTVQDVKIGSHFTFDKVISHGLRNVLFLRTPIYRIQKFKSRSRDLGHVGSHGD